MTKTEQKIIRQAIERLSPKSPQRSPDLEPHFEAARIYLQTWVIAPLELLSREDRTSDDLRLAAGLSR